MDLAKLKDIVTAIATMKAPPGTGAAVAVDTTGMLLRYGIFALGTILTALNIFPDTNIDELAGAAADIAVIAWSVWIKVKTQLHTVRAAFQAGAAAQADLTGTQPALLLATASKIAAVLDPAKPGLTVEVPSKPVPHT